MFEFERPLVAALAGLGIAALGVIMANEWTAPVGLASAAAAPECAAARRGATPQVVDATTGALAAAEVAALDVRYQAAVERNDARAMSEILHADFVLRLGDGRRITREALLRAARERHAEYERQVEVPGTQSVVVYGDAAIVTAQLWSKGTQGGKRFERRLWFSDTYVRTPTGWKYAFGQASLALPP